MGRLLLLGLPGWAAQVLPPMVSVVPPVMTVRPLIFAVVPVTVGARAVVGVVAPMVSTVWMVMTVFAVIIVIQRAHQRRPDENADNDMAQCR
jgi:uncharacterized membrane protein YphA (DoxX/SURF4 family)